MLLEADAVNRSRIAAALVAAATLSLANPSVVSADTYEEGLAAYEQRRYQRALDLWFPLALAGHCRAQFWLGELADRHSIHRSTTSVELDEVTAAKLKDSFTAAEFWYVEAAEQGHTGAMRELAYYYQRNIVPAHWLVKADFWQRRAADSGDLWSMRELMDEYYNDDPVESLKWALLLRERAGSLDEVDTAIASLSQRLTDEDVSLARREARRWEADRHPPTIGSPCE